MVSVTVNRSFDLGTFEFVTAEDMRELGLLAREQIVRRTIGGTDVHEAPFAPYSEGYAKAKGSTHVNLQVSGNMLNDLSITEIDVTEENARVRLGWNK